MAIKISGDTVIFDDKSAVFADVTTEQAKAQPAAVIVGQNNVPQTYIEPKDFISGGGEGVLLGSRSCTTSQVFHADDVSSLNALIWSPMTPISFIFDSSDGGYARLRTQGGAGKLRYNTWLKVIPTGNADQFTLWHPEYGYVTSSTLNYSSQDNTLILDFYGKQGRTAITGPTTQNAFSIEPIKGPHLGPYLSTGGVLSLIENHADADGTTKYSSVVATKAIQMRKMSYRPNNIWSQEQIAFLDGTYDSTILSIVFCPTASLFVALPAFNGSAAGAPQYDLTQDFIQNADISTHLVVIPPWNWSGALSIQWVTQGATLYWKGGAAPTIDSTKTTHMLFVYHAEGSPSSLIYGIKIGEF